MPVNTIPLFGSGPDAQVDQSQIARAQQLAQLLQQQALMPIESPSPNAPMSWTQGLAKLAQGLAAKKQNEKVTGMEKSATAQQQALIQSLFPQQAAPLPGATPEGQDLQPGGGVMANQATPGAQLAQSLAQKPGLPSLTGSRQSDMALASAPGGLQSYLQAVAAQRAKQAEEANKLTIVPEGAGVMRGPNQLVQGTPKPHPINWESTGSEKLPLDAMTGQRVQGVDPIKLTPTPEQAREAFDARHASLLAAMAARGVTLPSGLRSKEQMKATLDGLVQKYPNMGDDEIADNLANGKINFGAQNKAAQIAGGQAGKVALGLNEIKEFATIVKDASSKVPRGSFMPLTKLLQAGDAQISDPNLRQLKIAVTSMLNAYDQVAARGGTDVGKRAEAHALLTSADSPEALNSAVEMFQREAEAAERAAQSAMTRGTKTEGATGQHPADIQAILDSLKK